MREILFRGKRITDGEWIEGCMLKVQTGPAEDNFFIGIYDGTLPAYTIERNTLGQYTGLKDKTDRKIFEGDIVDMTGEDWDAYTINYASPICEVKWCDELSGFEPFVLYDCDCGMYINASGCSIIGNVHDNPELLVREKEELPDV